jgi:predicted ester cyclase
MKKANLELIRARYEAVNAHDLDRFQSFYADSVVWRDPGLTRAAKGPRSVRRRLESWIAAVPNLKWTLEDLFGEGDKLCAQFTFTGTHRGLLRDSRGNELLPTNRAVRVDGVGIYTVSGGQIVDSRILFDLGPFAQAPRPSPA